MSLTPRFPHFLHGGDYNPDQWLDHPDILERDVLLMEKAHVNAVSVGIFAWATLEPEEGQYNFTWLDEVNSRLKKHGVHMILATPSGARPAWMAEKYPEVLRVNDRFERAHFGGRHNHCPSSPVYRAKVQKIDRALAERYAGDENVILWHISNEFSGDCRCPLCQERFRTWLKDRYGTLDNLNRAWYTGFWSMGYTAWSQIEPPSPRGQMANLSLLLDWRRFSTWQCADFIAMERDTVKAVNPDLPVTANLMESFWDYDYFRLCEELDVVSWDCYPTWTGGDDADLAAYIGMNHDLMRSFRRQPFLLMESTPSLVNWKAVNKLKKPGMHLLSSLQAVAHGSNSVLYFQWRKGRGNAEMFHGAVVSHDGRDDTRVFGDVTEVGKALETLGDGLYASPVQQARVCILYDWSARWATEYSQVGLNGKMDYHGTALAHYRALWKMGIPVDFCDMRESTDLSSYSLVICPQLYLFMNGIEEKLRTFVENGGTLVMTCFSGISDATNLAFLADTPYRLTDVLGVRETELDALSPEECNHAAFTDGEVWRATGLCALPALEGAEVLAIYTDDFYAGLPAVIRNRFGKGEAWYLAARFDDDALLSLYARLSGSLKLPRALETDLPHGVTAHRRGKYVFVENYSGKTVTLSLPGTYEDALKGTDAGDTLTLAPCTVSVLLED